MPAFMSQPPPSAGPDCPGPQSDAALLARFAAGEAAAAAELTRRLLPRVHGQAWRMLGDAAEAEDVAQEAFLRLWRQAPEWRAGEAQVSTWLYRVVANLCTDRLRKWARRGGPPGAAPAEVDLPDPAAGPAEQLQTAARLQALRAALAELPERQRMAVALRHLEGLSNPEIAQIMDSSPEAVESLTARGKRALARTLAARREELGYEQ